MAAIKQDPELLVYQATRKAERLRQLQALEEKLPRRKGGEVVRLWRIINDTHDLLATYDLRADPPAIVDTLAELFESVLGVLYSIVEKAEADE